MYTVSHIEMLLQITSQITIRLGNMVRCLADVSFSVEHNIQCCMFKHKLDQTYRKAH